MTAVRFEIVHRRFVIRRSRRRVHWRQYRHGPDHDTRVAMRWAERWVVRKRVSLTSDPVMSVESPGRYGRAEDFIMNMDDPLLIDFRCIPFGQDSGLGIRFMVPEGIHALILDVR